MLDQSLKSVEINVKIVSVTMLTPVALITAHSQKQKTYIFATG